MIGALLGLSHAMVEDLSPTCPACHHHSYLIAQLNSFAFLICNSCQQASTKDHYGCPTCYDQGIIISHEIREFCGCVMCCHYQKTQILQIEITMKLVTKYKLAAKKKLHQIFPKNASSSDQSAAACTADDVHQV